MKLTDWNGKEISREVVKSQVGPGWGLLVDQLIDDLFAMGWCGEVHQIKEKFGGLRFYTTGGPEIQDRIEDATDSSTRICERCGQPGKTGSWGGYWWLTLCPIHGEARRLDVEASKRDE